MMQELSIGKRVVYRTLGAIFYGTYRTNHRQFLGVTWGWIIRRLMFVPVVWGLVARWGQWVWLAVGLALLGNMVYWYAARVGYSRFVAAQAQNVAEEGTGEEIRPLAPNEKIPIQATGLFSVRDRESFVLQRTAQYWQVPLGDHVVMVQYGPGSYLYQFFDAVSLQQVQPGWLIFGSDLHPVLAITFRTKWAPQFAQFEIRYYVQDDVEPEAPLRTIYFSFASEAEKVMVWRNIVRDARRVRSAKIGE